MVVGVMALVEEETSIEQKRDTDRNIEREEEENLVHTCSLCVLISSYVRYIY